MEMSQMLLHLPPGGRLENAEGKCGRSRKQQKLKLVGRQVERGEAALGASKQTSKQAGEKIEGMREKRVTGTQIIMLSY